MDQERLNATVARLRRQGTDDATCEVKACVGGLGGSVWESVSAFANTAGGVLLLGLSEDDGFAPATGFDPDRIVDQFVAGIGDAGETGAKLLNPPTYVIDRRVVDGAPILVIEIAENEMGNKPCSVKSRGIERGSYKRVDDKDVRLSTSEIFEMRQALLPQESDRAVVAEADTTDLDEHLVAALVERQGRSRALRGVQSTEDALKRLNVLDKDGQVRLAGLLTLGAYPQQFVPRLMIDVTTHPTNEKSSPATPVRFVDRVQCDGPLPEAIDAAVNAVAKNLRTYSVVAGTGRTDQLEIPLDVLREAIANAAVHREYHDLFRGQPVTVDVFPDRVVVMNPGGLWGGKTLDNLDDGTSRCRNQTLMQLLQSVPFESGTGPTVEGQGGGVRLMIHQMEAHALDRPMFSANADQVIVTMRRHGAEVPEHRAWLRSMGDRSFTAQEDAALVMARRHGTVGVERLHSDMRMDSDDARVLLARLEREGLLREIDWEEYALTSEMPEMSEVESAVYYALSPELPYDIQYLADVTGRSPTALRPVLRRMVDAGLIDATAPPTSRLRRYLRNDRVQD